jgi:hypothetical protein
VDRNGLGADIFIIGLLSPDPLSQQGALAILQIWTFFRVLSDVLGENVSPLAIYIPPAGDGTVPYIGTTALTGMMSSWFACTASKNL